MFAAAADPAAPEPAQVMAEIDRYDYELPRERIAQNPLASRADARLLLVDRSSESLEHLHVRDLPEVLRPGDCLVLNDTRVIPARLLGFRTATRGHWEGLFLDCTADGLWRILGKTRGKLVAGETITLINAAGVEDVRLRLGARLPEGVWAVRPESDEPHLEILQRVGRVPLPPYIRGGEMVESDRARYQTVFASVPGAVAAPTAGLHFTEPLLKRLRERGVESCRLTLHVGPGTFRPITADTLSEHRMHAEWGRLRPDAAEQLHRARQRGGRIVAVGTTAVRLLETAATDGTLRAYVGQTHLFIHPPYEFRAVDALLTNFHLPRSTLLVLVRTFGGDALIRRAYEEAIREDYRFYSYGDAMLIV